MNGRIVLATPIIMEKRVPNTRTARKNNQNLKSNNRLENAVIEMKKMESSSLSLRNQYIDVIIGKE